jgi:hypothetical protein
MIEAIWGLLYFLGRVVAEPGVKGGSLHVYRGPFGRVWVVLIGLSRGFLGGSATLYAPSQ